MPRNHLKLTCVLFALAVLTGMPARAQESVAQPVVASKGQVVLVVRTGEHQAFDRVVFDAPRGVAYKIRREGERIFVQFSVPAKVSVPSIKLSRVRDLAVAAGLDGLQPLTMVFRVAPGATFKDFMSGTSIVIDVMGPASPPVSAPAAKLPPQMPSRPESKPELKPELKPDPKPDLKEEPKPAPAAAPGAPPASPPSKEPEAPPAKEGEPVPAPPKGEALAPTPAAAPVSAVEEPHSLPSQIVDRRTDPALAPMLDAKTTAAIMAIVNEQPSAPVVSFDPKISIGAVIYARGGTISVIFDRKLAASPLLAGTTPRVKLEPFDLPRNTGFRIVVPEGVGVRATRSDTAWEIFLVRAGAGKGISTEFVAQPDFALGARLLVPTVDPPEPIYYADPVVGDDLILLPLRETGAFTLPRRLADFQVVPAAQGLVIKPWHEKVVVRRVPDGIEITSEGGLKLSPSIDTGVGAKDADKARGAAKSLFDFVAWRGRPGEPFTETRQKLMQTIIDVSEDQRLLARLDLARFYLANGMGPEALALLELIAKSLPEIVAQPDYVAVRGAARVLAGQAAEGFADFNHPSLAGRPEAVLWQAIALASLRDWGGAEERFKTSFRLLAHYPEPFRSRFQVLGIESALAAGKDQEAADWVAAVEKAGHDPVTEPAMLYLRGVLYSKAGRIEAAEKLWKQVAANTDRLYKIRAELALVDLGVATKSLSPKQAVDRLEGLRYAWRGDDLEFDILHRLGGFYIDARDFPAGLGVWSQAARLFPNSPMVVPLKAEMASVFKNIFLTDLGGDLSPLEYLSLYNDYKYLIPKGEEGNAVRRNLAERLVNIDLLDQAAKLLEDLVKNSSSAEERVQTATRLAGVRLLDYRGEEALAVLDQSEADAATVSDSLKEERALLRARAFSEMGQYDKAVEALPPSGSKMAMLLRADIALRARQWAQAVTALKSLIGPPPKPGQALSVEQAGWLVSAAIAMVQAGDSTGLDHLATDYGAAMDQTAKADVFRVLTQPEKATQVKDIAAAQSSLSQVDMFRGFLDSYRKDGKK